MKELIDIITGYEGAIQENEDEHSEETAARLETARNELMDVLRLARNFEELVQAAETGLKFAEGGWDSPTRDDTMRILQTAIQTMKGETHGSVL